MNFLRAFFSLDKRLARVEGAILTASVVLLLAFAFLQVVLRNVFDSGIPWGDVFNRLMVLWIGFFGATLAAGKDRHLSLEVLTKFLPERAKPLVNVVVTIFVIAVTATFTRYSWLFFMDQVEFESSDLLFTGLPKAYFTIVFPLGFGLVGFRYFVKLVKNIVALIAGPDEASAIAGG